jgi:hypothetical protein
VIYVINKHNHDSLAERLEVAAAVNQVRERARNTVYTAFKFSTERRGTYRSRRSHTISKDSVRKMVQRQRKEAVSTVILASVKNLVIPESLDVRICTDAV